MANEEYKFPDEQDVTPDIEIDIEEDTPEEDRDRKSTRLNSSHT